MNRSDIRMLQSAQGNPAVSIVMPTHRAHPENRQDQIRLRKLVSLATDRLLAEFPRRDIAPVLAQIEHLVADTDNRHALDGLALFANRDLALRFELPFAVPERVVVNDSFATRELVFALNRSPRYWVLALSEKPSRLYEGARDTLVEVKSAGFPMIHEGPGGEAPLPSGYGVRRSAHRDEGHRQFFRQVDAAFGKVAGADQLPLVLVGVERHLAFFDEVSKHKHITIGRLPGSHDKTSAHDLGRLVWPIIQQYLDEQRATALQALQAAVGTRQFASGIGEVWRAAEQGRGDTLLVEEDYRAAGRVGANGGFEAGGDPAAPDTISDAVDEVIETVLDKDGQVVFVENGALGDHQRIALILRY